MRRSVSFGVKGLGLVLAGTFLVAACGGDGETGERPEETGGSSGTGATGGTSGTGTGGSATGGSATGGSATGGSAGTASCVAPITMCDPPCMPATCETVTPPRALITDFSNLLNGQLFGSTDENGVTIPMWWEPGNFFGGIFAYPIVPNMCSTDMTPHEYPVTSDACDGEWRLTGTVGEYSGFGIWLETCMVDMSAYSGISFKIGGNVGPSGTLKFSIGHSANAAPSACDTNRGTCTLGEGACLAASTTITVPSTPTVVTVNFADLTGGAPEATLNPAEVTSIDFALDCADCTMNPYELDLTIDDVTLVE
jgi:hypothetical protein